MTTALERARSEDRAAIKKHEVQALVRSTYYAFRKWYQQDRNAYTVLLFIPGLQFRDAQKWVTTSKDPMKPTRKGEHARWLFTDTINGYDEQIFLAHYEYWRPGVSVLKQPTHTETYHINKEGIWELHANERLSFRDLDTIKEIVSQMKQLMGKGTHKSPARSASQQGRGKE